jgi:hypothetical protein
VKFLWVISVWMGNLEGSWPELDYTRHEYRLPFMTYETRIQESLDYDWLGVHKL